LAARERSAQSGAKPGDQLAEPLANPWLKLAESAFAFWDNADDAAYDAL
jgi:hypothetical protein